MRKEERKEKSKEMRKNREEKDGRQLPVLKRLASDDTNEWTDERMDKRMDQKNNKCLKKCSVFRVLERNIKWN